jgi:hypothetical protein
MVCRSESTLVSRVSNHSFFRRFSLLVPFLSGFDLRVRPLMKSLTSILAVARMNTLCMAGSGAGRVLISCRVCAARPDVFEEGVERGNGGRDSRSR